MADIEKARVIVRNIRQMADDASRSRASGPWLSAVGAAEEALRALDGEGAEEWEAMPDGREWRVQKADTGWIIAERMEERDARRIARLPALERAAQRALDLCPPNSHLNEHQTAQAFVQVYNELRAALNQEGQ